MVAPHTMPTIAPKWMYQSSISHLTRKKRWSNPQHNSKNYLQSKWKNHAIENLINLVKETSPKRQNKTKYYKIKI